MIFVTSERADARILIDPQGIAAAIEALLQRETMFCRFAARLTCKNWINLPVSRINGRTLLGKGIARILSRAIPPHSNHGGHAIFR
jgi:hypothetical protein